jgi:DNA-binding XRE family transcriptional regulator
MGSHHGLTIAELAARAGVNRFLVGAIDREEGNPPSGTVQLKLAEALEATVQDLFWSEPVPPVGNTEPVEAAS